MYVCALSIVRVRKEEGSRVVQCYTVIRSTQIQVKGLELQGFIDVVKVNKSTT